MASTAAPAPAPAPAPAADFHIRYATKDDMHHILALITELAIYEKEPEAVEATDLKLLTTLGFNPAHPSPAYAKTLLLFSPDEPETPAGMALYFPSYSTWRAAPGIWLEDLFVREAYRGRGYGTALIAALAREVKSMGGGRLEWSVLKWNLPSVRFYEGPSIGAKAMGEWQTMRVDGERLEVLAGKGVVVTK